MTLVGVIDPAQSLDLDLRVDRLCDRLSLRNAVTTHCNCQVNVEALRAARKDCPTTRMEYFKHASFRGDITLTFSKSVSQGEMCDTMSLTL